MTWTHLPLGNKTSRFTQSALALMIAGTLPAYAGTFNPRFLEDVPGIDQHVDLSMYESIKLNTCRVNTASRWWSTKNGVSHHGV